MGAIRGELLVIIGLSLEHGSQQLSWNALEDVIVEIAHGGVGISPLAVGVALAKTLLRSFR